MIRVPRPTSLPPANATLVVVEASAGTGKTFFLEHRVVDLILAGAELGQILLVTFTEKAVAELRLRIRDLLDRLARAEVDTESESCWHIDDDARRRLRAAVTQFDHAPIYTIHGFCHRILVEDAFAAHRLFEQTQVADEVAFDTAFNALLRERFARISPDRELLAAFLETGRTVERLRDVLLNCARAGQDARVRRRLDPDHVRAVVGALREQFGTEARRNVTLSALASDRRWVPDWVQTIAHALERCPEDAEPARLVAMLDEVREPAEYLAKRSARLPEAIASAVRAVASTITLDEAVAAAMLPPLLARIHEDKAEHGQFDYDDMLQLVWKALRGPRRELLAARLRERTPWVMIDEFQDTDPVQWNIFRTVWMHPAARGLTIVGDPKQAIYGFRGADVQTYVAAREEMLRAGATRVPLTVNRRSSEPLVAAVNQILVGNVLVPLLDKSITYDEPVSASGDITCDDVRPPITVFQLQSTGKGQGEPNRLALQIAIGDGIEALRANPPVWRVRGVEQPFALGQIMVLTRTNRDSTEIASALRARGLPCALLEPEKLFDTREASELACVLAAIAAPRDRSARLRALRTRFFDVPWNELVQVVDAPDHHPLIARIFDWAQLAARRAYESLFRRLVEDSRYAERALVLGGGERALTNTWHLIELLLAEVSRSRSDLHELVLQLRRWIADTAGHPDERDVQRAETDADAVRILTIHKAKGLEAAYVFVYGGTSGGPKSGVHMLRDGAGRAIVVGTPDDDTQKLLDDEAEAENQRLAYVALTRAQIRMYLPIYGELVLQKNAAYQPIQRSLLPYVAPKVPLPRPLFQTIGIPVGAPSQPPAPADALADLVTAPPPPPSELPPLAFDRRGLAMVSYTRLAHDLDTAQLPVAIAGDVLAIDPAEFDVDDARSSDGAAARAHDDPKLDSAIQLAPGELPAGADSGLLLHDVLEVADLDVARAASDASAWASDPDVAAQLADAARARGVAARYLPHAAQLIHATLTAPLALTDGRALPPLVAAEALAREVEFSYPIPQLAGKRTQRGLVRGFIDALVAWPDDGELWVLDYKSDVLAAGDRASASTVISGDLLHAAAMHRVREHYAIQARLYAIAADRMRGRRRLAGLLFAFVRYGIVVPVRVGEGSLEAWTDWLGRIATVLPDTAASMVASLAGSAAVTKDAEVRA
ncbi:MAG TPA: UvrD-helicase domain-containing protein [Kofleriaceae bacterium]|nr:UvrD-helicase domain-containing protein [Kofleriaceae bacterium]